MTQLEHEIKRDFLGVVGLNPFIGYDSSSRVQMFSSHISQTLVTHGGTERFIQTGMENEFGKYTYSISMPVDAQIIRVIDKVKRAVGFGAIVDNPLTAVIYEDVNTNQIGILMLPKFCSHHPYFGFRYKEQPALEDVRAQAFIKAGTVLLDSPNKDPIEGYRYGIECNMAFMSHPSVSEDGVLISRDVLEKFAINSYETRVVEFGSRRIPLNLYGDSKIYKPYPDIGQVIRSDGLLMGTRTFSEDEFISDMSVQSMMSPDFTYDNLVYAAGPGGRVVDIKVYNGKENKTLPLAMSEQVSMYDKYSRDFYMEIYDEYRRLLSRRHKNLNLTPEFSRLIVEIMARYPDPKEGKKPVLLYRQAELDEWRVEFTIEYYSVPSISYKVTDTHGGKGVIVKVAEPHEMPIDEAGNRADIVMDQGSVNSRMNFGRLYEQYINAASRDVAKHVRNMLDMKTGEKSNKARITEMVDTDNKIFHKAWKYLLGYYEIVSPKMYTTFNKANKKQIIEHMDYVVTKYIVLYIPPEHEVEMTQVVSQLEKQYRPTYGPVSYVGLSGERVTTVDNVRIGSMYILLLEKTGDDWMAVSSAKFQHFGVLSQVTATDKYSQPARTQAVRALGEAEVRIYASYVGPEVTADILDRHNSKASLRNIAENIMNATRPTDIDEVIDRKIVPLGNSKPLQLAKHIAACGGWEFKYEPYVDHETQYYLGKGTKTRKSKSPFPNV